MAGELAVEAVGIEKSYGAVRVLAGVDLRVARGTVFALLGPNGAGKTTLVRILSTLLRADAGHARVAGFDVVRDRRLARRSISLTGQYVALDQLQTGAENLRMISRIVGLRGEEARRRTRELLILFDLVEAAGRQVKTYSGGLRRRLDLAASLVGQPSVIFLDEPTTGLDLRSRQVLWQIIADLAGSGLTVFLTTQYLEEADLLAGHVAVLDGGLVVAEGTPAQLKKQVAEQRLDLTLTDTAGYDSVLDALGDRVLGRDAGRLTVAVATDGSAAHVRALLDEVDPHRCAVAKFGVRTATLDDVFLALTGHPLASQPASTPQEMETADV